MSNTSTIPARTAGPDRLFRTFPQASAPTATVNISARPSPRPSPSVELEPGIPLPSLQPPTSTSSASGPWRGVLLEQHAGNAPLGRLDVAPHDLLVLVQLGSCGELESKESGGLRTHRLLPGQSVLIPPWQRFSLRTPAGGHTLGATLDAAILHRAAGHLFANPNALEVRLNGAVDDPLLCGVILALRAEAEAGFPGGRSGGDSLAAQLAVHLAHRYLVARAGHAATQRRMHRVLGYLQTHAAEAVPLGVLAAEAGLSVFHFVRVFKQVTGLSPHQYLLRCRVERARHLLLTTGLQGREVARAAGFCSQSHLITHFKRVFRVTPKRFLRRMNTEAC